MNDAESRQFESYLKQFRFRAPAPLPEARPLLIPRRQLQFALAAAVVVIVGAAILLLEVHQRDSETSRLAAQQTLTLGRLNRLLQSDDRQLDVVLTSGATQVLPDVERSGGLLRTLSDE